MRAHELESLIYFAYGHNTNTEAFKKRCPHAEYLGVGVLNNFKLIFKQFADIQNDDGAKCYGVLWKITRNDLKTLDHDEGLHKFYNRIPVQVHLDNKTVSAMAYIMDPANKSTPDPSDRYIKSVEAGYKEHGLPMEQLQQAIANDVNISEK